MPLVILRLLMGENFPDDGLVVFTANWNDQFGRVGPISTSNLVIVEREIAFEVCREDSALTKETKMLISFTCQKTGYSGSSRVTLSLYNLLFQKTIVFDEVEDSRHGFPLLNVFFRIDGTFPLSTAKLSCMDPKENFLSRNKLTRNSPEIDQPMETDDETDCLTFSSKDQEETIVSKEEIRALKSERLEMYESENFKPSWGSDDELSEIETTNEGARSLHEVTLDKATEPIQLGKKARKEVLDEGEQDKLIVDQNTSMKEQEESDILLVDPKLYQKCSVVLTRLSYNLVDTESSSKTSENIESVQIIDLTGDTSCDSEDSALDSSLSPPKKKKLYNRSFSQVYSNQKEYSANCSVDASFRSLPEINSKYQRKHLCEPVNGVDERLATRLKNHQKDGVTFMWKSMFANRSPLDNPGCVLAHASGLGKTLQVVALSQALLTTEYCKVKRMLVVAPSSMVAHWVNEFERWLPEDSSIIVYEFVSQPDWRVRGIILNSWRHNGGVMVVSYDIYRSLTSFDVFVNDHRSNLVTYNVFRQALVRPGPDVLVCDEGHLLFKNPLLDSISRVSTNRRIVLTSKPLLTNLAEYHAMIEFVRPNLFHCDFHQKFIEPITKGLNSDASREDVKFMKHRTYVLLDTIKDCVQRCGYSVLNDCLPPKFEFVIAVKLTSFQKKLYKHYMNVCAKGKKIVQANSFIADFKELGNVWSHPKALVTSKSRELSEDDTVESDGTSDASDNLTQSDNHERLKGRVLPWWSRIVSSTEHDFDDVEKGGKMSVLFDIIKHSERNGDKLAIFSRSEATLDAVEFFLQVDDDKRRLSNKPRWCFDEDYLRINQLTDAEKRSKRLQAFNDPKNRLARLFLLSTEVARSGVDLRGANRIVMLDVSWNPSDDLVCLLSVYWLGQKDHVFVYKLIASETVEQKLYNLQVSKRFLGTLIEGQENKLYTRKELMDLYTTPIDGHTSECDVNKDTVLSKFYSTNQWIDSVHQHESLLEEQPDELSERDQRMAWRSFYEC